MIERVIVLDVFGESWSMLSSKAQAQTDQVHIDGVADVLQIIFLKQS